MKARPAVVTEVIAALDEWAIQRRRVRKPNAPWEPVAELAAALDDHPDSLRRELRDILARGRLPVERVLSTLAARLRPVPVPFPVPLGPDRLRLRELVRQTNPAAVPVLGLLTLVRALHQAGEEESAERLLRTALVARPREVVLHFTLGSLFTVQTPPRWRDEVESYVAARVLRPDLGVNLAEALLSCGPDEEGFTLLARLVEKSPKNPYLHH